MSKILICRNCHKEFPPFIYVDGIRIPGYTRMYCYICSPFKQHTFNLGNTTNRNTEDGKRQCLICEQFLDLLCFSRTNQKGNLNSYCKRCATNKTQKSRQRFKRECVEYKGGKCFICGYDRCFASMHFHHKDPTLKEFEISKACTTILSDYIKTELDKCELVCANCHGEIEYGTN